MAKKSSKTKTKVGIKEPEIRPAAKKKAPPRKPPKSIKMLISCANQYMAYIKGHIYDVPEEVSVQTARSWISSEAAEKVE